MRHLNPILFGILAATSSVNFFVELAYAPSIFNHALTGWLSATLGWTVAFVIALRRDQ